MVTSLELLLCCCCRTLLLPSPGTCVPASEGRYSMGVWQKVVQLSHDILSQTYEVPLVDTYKWTVPLHGAHIYLGSTGWDCLHYCRPGLPEVRTAASKSLLSDCCCCCCRQRAAAASIQLSCQLAHCSCCYSKMLDLTLIARGSLPRRLVALP